MNTNQSEQAKDYEVPNESFDLLTESMKLKKENDELRELLKQSQQGIKQWVSEWIDVKDSLPERGVKVLCINEQGYMKTGSFFAEYEYFAGDDSWSNITHWQALPEPPNSTTTPKSDYVNKDKVIEILESVSTYSDQVNWVIQECITKIKGL